jgi:hypothetical protein
LNRPKSNWQAAKSLQSALRFYGNHLSAGKDAFGRSSWRCPDGSSFDDRTSSSISASVRVREIRKIWGGALPNYKWGEYADRFFKECLGVSDVNSLDYSSYEGADILHDLNQPVPANLKGRFDAVVEGGSLEHIFHFPIAVANLMQMTKVGGTIFASTVSNNLCGHGFYQFSPELIFRAISSILGRQRI